jgi:hypothetical protein
VLIGVVALVLKKYYTGPGKRRSKSMKSEDLDKIFDSGEDISKYLDLSGIRRPGQEQKLRLRHWGEGRTGAPYTLPPALGSE